MQSDKEPVSFKDAVVQDLRDNRDMIKRNQSAIMFLLFLNSGGLLLAGVIYYLAKIGEL